MITQLVGREAFGMTKPHVHKGRRPLALIFPAFLLLAAAFPTFSLANEASLRIPDLHSVRYFGFIDGWTLLVVGLAICIAGLAFGLVIQRRLKALSRPSRHERGFKKPSTPRARRI